jgi:hypothetical protein
MPFDNAIMRHHYNAVANNKLLYQTPPMGGAGDFSTVRTIVVNHPELNGGKPTVIPTIWDGKMMSNHDAIAHAIESGQTWPVDTADPNQPWSQSPDAAWHQEMYQMGTPPEIGNAFLSPKYRFQ